MAAANTDPNNATDPTAAAVTAFLDTVPNATMRQDSHALAALMSEVTGCAPRLWGPSIVGFGDYHYKYASGREGDTFLLGFSPRKAAITLYITGRFGAADDLVARLGKCKTGVGCLYIKKLADVDQAVLRQVLAEAVDRLQSPPAG